MNTCLQKRIEKLGWEWYIGERKIHPFGVTAGLPVEALQLVNKSPAGGELVLLLDPQMSDVGIAMNIKKEAENFKVDQYVKFHMDLVGKDKRINTVEELEEDANAVQKMLRELAASVSECLEYIYYLTQRPPMPGAFPKPAGNKILDVVSFDDRTYIEEIGKDAWGYVTYSEPLSQQDIDDYELN